MVAPTDQIINVTRVRISKSGQVTLPVSVRKVLGVEIGDRVEFIERADGSIGVHNGQPIAIEEFAGSLGPPPGNQTLAEYIGEIDRQSMVRSLYEETKSPYDPD